jgi:hypothetical protein
LFYELFSVIEGRSAPIEPASINPNPDRKRGVYVYAGRSDYVEGKAVL